VAPIQSPRSRPLQQLSKKESPGKVIQIDARSQKEAVEAYIKHKLSELERE
jgi:hypothetical protein